MKVAFIAINAKYIHASPAIRSLAAYSGNPENLILLEFNINMSMEKILADIYAVRPGAVCFSCYIWNMERIGKLCGNIRKLLPEAVIILGGPEVSYEYNDFLDFSDLIIRGEGERAFQFIMDSWEQGLDFTLVPNGVYKQDGQIKENDSLPSVSLDTIPFIYNDKALQELENKILYYESARGCPFSCQYCLSSLEKGVRFLSLERVYRDLDFFLSRQVKQVKFIDRTFNCHRPHCEAIWRYLISHDNCVTNFHFEISAALLDDGLLDLLSNARPGLFQLEIGLQTINLAAMENIRRQNPLDIISSAVTKLVNMGNIHLHLDLIAGLPGEGYESFGESFDYAYHLGPHRLQLGFLKLLRGSGLRENAAEMGIVYDSAPPYQVLYTKELSFEELARLTKIEEVLNLYGNSHRYRNTLAYIKKKMSPFQFYEGLSRLRERATGEMGKKEASLLLYRHMAGLFPEDQDIWQDLLKFDLLLFKESGGRFFDFMEESMETRAKARRFFANPSLIEKYLPHLKAFPPNQLSRLCEIGLFGRNLYDYSPESQYYLFDYSPKPASLQPGAAVLNITKVMEE